MRYWLVIIPLALLSFSINAQTNETTVVQVFTIETPDGFDARASSIRWSPNSRLIAMSFNVLGSGAVSIAEIWHLYDVATGERITEFSEFIAWYADSSHLLVRPSLGAQLTVIDAQTATPLFRLDNRPTKFPNETIVNEIVSLDATNTLRIYDSETRNIRLTLDDVAEFPFFSPDRSRFVVSIRDVGVQVYDASSFDMTHSLEGYRTGNAREGTWSPDGQQLLVIPLDSIYQRFGPRHVWTLNAGLSAPIYNLTGRVTWSPDGARIVGPSDYTKIRIYDAPTGELLETIFEFGEGPIHGLSWDGRYLWGSSGGLLNSLPGYAVSVYDLERGEFAFNRHVGIGWNYNFEGDVLDILERFDGFQRINVQTGEILLERSLIQNPPYLLPSPDWRWITANNTNFEPGVPATIDVYDLETFELVATSEGHTEIIQNIVWSPDNIHFASVGEPGPIIVWEITP
jgi:WD40 repeat protein